MLSSNFLERGHKNLRLILDECGFNPESPFQVVEIWLKLVVNLPGAISLC